MGYSLQRFVKRNFLRFKLHRVISPLEGVFLQLAYLSKFSRFAAEHRKLHFNDFYKPGFDMRARDTMYASIAEKEQLFEAIDYLEFGVSKARSFTWWIGHNQHPESRFYGFDTFEGLPEKWGNFEKGAMSANVPDIEGSRHQFFVGLFQDTMDGFLAGFTRKKRMVVHFDADLYTATYYALNKIAPLLQPGDVIFFDEFGVPMHEFKAFTEFFESYYWDYEVLGACNNYYQLVVKIK